MSVIARPRHRFESEKLNQTRNTDFPLVLNLGCDQKKLNTFTLISIFL
ncbi:hypothetical protein GXM_05525 [Nostoc sphaeroides CCNUC1]|uniref:Uncharacterized protein n=1 Tax=Nostoc sphaeroides CCNUC1 TaxID=2653204 RepID=A0A5P8W5L3_9NOSO|nr:hypothetical protein GXM_05525 [Nostoc sphaeroides CCNUC1]